jgi:hypothetical protein
MNKVDWDLTDGLNSLLQLEKIPFNEVFPFWDKNIDKVKNIFYPSDFSPKRNTEHINEHEWYENRLFVWYENNVRYVSRHICTQDPDDGLIYDIGEGVVLYPK